MRVFLRIAAVRFTRQMLVLPLIGCLLAPVASAQKKPITQDTYDLWNTIGGTSLSADGQWLAYTLSPVIGNGSVAVRSTKSSTEWKFARGYTGRPQLMPRADSTAQFPVPAAQFSADSKWLAFITYPSQADVARVPAGRGGRGAAAGPRNSLTLVNLADGKATVIPRVRSFRFARDGGKYVAYLTESDTAAAGGSGGAGGGGAGGGGGRGGRGGGGGAGGSAAQEPGAPLMLRDLAAETEAKIDNVTSYLLDDAEKFLAYTTSSADSSEAGAWVRELGAAQPYALATGKGNYKLLTLDRKGSQVAFVSNRGEKADKDAPYSLYYATLAKGQSQPARRAVASGSVGKDVLIADRGRVDFVRDGSALQFALAPVVAPAVPADSLADKAIYDLWSWNDTKIQPQQVVDAPRDRNRTWAAVYLPNSGRWTRLGTDSLTQVTLADNGRIALALNPVEYAIEQTWGDGGADAYIADVGTGATSLIAKHLEFGAQLSPGSKYVTFWQDGKWWAVATGNSKKVELSANIKGVRLDNELFDSPDTPPAYGLGGWTTDDKTVLVYDRYDIWEVDPSNGVARNVTAGAGRAKNISYRAVNLDVEDRFLDAKDPLVVRGFNDEDKASGYFRAHLGVSAAPEQIVYGPKSYNGLAKARHAEQYTMTQQTYREFPDIWTGSTIGNAAKITNANPQERDYPRGDVELVNWLNDDGVKLQGLLYKPEGFDPNKKYPMITYFYERLSDGLHSYVAPTGRNVSNPYVYTSLGYLVFHPDIVYTDGFPGPSAVKSIVPGVNSLIQRGFVDPKKLGINGQSWGGYQSAYLITATHMFAAAVPNATVVNMTSAYGGIRWGPGVLRQFQYEHTQSRIGGSLWEYPERFIENSPLFKLDRVTTPVLFMANDQDDAVPWYQGIEFYSAMRRLKKEAYLVVYNGEGHNPSKRANQKDIDKKMQEFFANKLLGSPAPGWMKKGIPFLDKGKDQIKATVP